MSDTSPSEPESGGAGRGSGDRRSGLDRLRAVRGDSPPAGTPGTSEPTDDAPARAGSTALLETPSTTRGDGVEQSELDAADVDDDRSGRRRLRRTSRGGSARAATKDAAPATDEVGPGAARGRREQGRAKAIPTRTGGRPAPAPSSRRQVLVAIGLALLVIALAIPVVGMWPRLGFETKDERNVRKLVEKREAGLIAGRQFAITFFTFDYNKVDEYTRQVSSLTVGDFNKDFVAKGGQLKATLQQVQSVASARLLSAAVSKVSGDNVEVLIVADQDVKNKLSKGKVVTNRYRLAVTMQQTPTGWLVNAVTPAI